MEAPWPYGDLPIHIATTHTLADPEQSTSPTLAVTPVVGSIGRLVTDALHTANGKDVYVDGGTVVRDALITGVLDDLVVTINPTVLGVGVPLFDATVPRTDLTVVGVARFTDGFVQIHYRCR